MIISVQNPTENNYTIVSASASYHDPAKNWKLVRNATNIKLDIPLDSGVNATAAYRLNSEYVYSRQSSVFPDT
jgi:hypothetical protein